MVMVMCIVNLVWVCEEVSGGKDIFYVIGIEVFFLGGVRVDESGDIFVIIF